MARSLLKAKRVPLVRLAVKVEEEQEEEEAREEVREKRRVACVSLGAGSGAIKSWQWEKGTHFEREEVAVEAAACWSRSTRKSTKRKEEEVYRE